MLKWLKVTAAFTGVAAYIVAAFCLWLIGSHVQSIYIMNWDYTLFYGGMGLKALSLLAVTNLVYSSLKAIEEEWAMEQTRQMIDTAVNLRKAAAKKEKQDEKAD
jgi:glycine cleavage system protein P-like pyridoxal-binding family